MTDQNQHSIQAPPSLEEILAAGDAWVGRVDFEPPATVPAPEIPVVAPEIPVVATDSPAVPDPTDETNIEELVAEAIGLVTDAREARIRHEEALLLEVARRCETIRVQAELDAELTMLLARRRAYALVAAADPQSREAREVGRLDELIRLTSRMTDPEPADTEAVPQAGAGPGQ